MHYGFAMPLHAVWGGTIAVLALVPSGWVRAGVLTGFLVLLAGGDALARWRALVQVRLWASARGIRDVRPCPRLGLITWEWSVWSFAETRPYCGVAADGSPAELLASYYAPAFGLVVFTQCEARAEPGTTQGTGRRRLGKDRS